jgi:two-component system, chemotaxis family, protein-glutamate methylesterase/glutaminase
MDRVLKVLIVDDSAYVRKVIKQMLSRSPFLDVVGTARDGEDALKMVEQLQPDVVTVDLIMPGMGGLGLIREQMARQPVPMVIVSIASETSQMVLDALDAGAIDFVQKPSALATEKVFEMSSELIEKVKAAGMVHMSPVSTLAATTEGAAASVRAVQSASRTIASAVPFDIVVLGVSTGGPQALRYLIPRLPVNFPVPIAVVLHMPVGYTEMYAQKLDKMSQLSVQEAHEESPVRTGEVLLAPAGKHLTIRRDAEGRAVAHLDARPFDTLHRPSVDVLFSSAAEAFESRVLGIVMTGMGDDGTEGARMIRGKGGRIFAEAEQTCVVYGMPRSVIEAGLADRVVPLDRMADAIVEGLYGNGSNRR